MPDLLIELFSEEIPARMQGTAREALKKLVTDGLVEAGLTYEGAGAFSTPRRLALTVHGLTAESKPVREERKGPRTDAPAAALEGFLRQTVQATEVRLAIGWGIGALWAAWLLLAGREPAPQGAAA